MRQPDVFARADDEAVDLDRFSTSLLICATIATPLAALAVRWPEPVLTLAMVASGGVIGTFGIFDLAAAVVSGTIPSVRAFFVGHGMASVGFGIITASLPVASAPSARRLAIVWLALYAVFLALLTWRLWFFPHARYSLMAWCVLNAALAVALALTPPLSTDGMLYVTAAYTCLLGGGMLAAGLTMQHDLAQRHALARHASRQPAAVE